MSETGQRESRAPLTVRAAKAGADVAEASYRTPLEVETKGAKTDVVTQADRDAQRAVIDVIREAYPNDAVVGEEEDELKTVPNEGAAWIVDPIDGTNNYVRGIPVWGTAVAAVVDEEPVAAAIVLPILAQTYRVGPDGVTLNGTAISVSDRTDPGACTVTPTMWWDFDHRDEYARATRAVVERFGDMRRFGCAQATLAMVASGALDGTLTNLPTNSWDTVAGVQMIRAAGGTVTDLDGNRWRHDSRGLVASNGAIHDLFLEAAREIEQ